MERKIPWQHFEKMLTKWLFLGGISEPFGFTTSGKLGKSGEICLTFRRKKHNLTRNCMLKKAGREVIVSAYCVGGVKSVKVSFFDGKEYDFYYDTKVDRFFYLYQGKRFYLIVITESLHCSFGDYIFLWSSVNWKAGDIFVVGVDTKRSPCFFKKIGQRQTVNPKIITHSNGSIVAYVLGKRINVFHRPYINGWMDNIEISYHESIGYHINFCGRRYFLKKSDAEFLNIKNGDRIKVLVEQGWIILIKFADRKIRLSVFYSRDWTVLYSTMRSFSKNLFDGKVAIITNFPWRVATKKPSHYMDINYNRYYLPIIDLPDGCKKGRLSALFINSQLVFYRRLMNFNNEERRFVNDLIVFFSRPLQDRKIAVFKKLFNKIFKLDLADDEYLYLINFFQDDGVIDQRHSSRAEYNELLDLLTEAIFETCRRGVKSNDSVLAGMHSLRNALRRIEGKI